MDPTQTPRERAIEKLNNLAQFYADQTDALSGHIESRIFALCVRLLEEAPKEQPLIRIEHFKSMIYFDIATEIESAVNGEE